MKALYNEKEMLMASNKSLAEYNMSQEPVLREAKEKLLEKYTEATRLSEEVRSLQSQLEQKSGNVRPDTLLALLEAANQVYLCKRCFEIIDVTCFVRRQRRRARR